MKLGLLSGEHGFTRGQIIASYWLSTDRHSYLVQTSPYETTRLDSTAPMNTSGRRTYRRLTRGYREDPYMNKDIFEGKWKQMKGQIKVAWGKLTDDDLDTVAGKYDKFVGLLQEKYGYTRERAEEEVDRQIAEHESL